MSAARHLAAAGAGLVVLYTGLISGADAITKHLAGHLAAPQMYALAGLAVAGLSAATARATGQGLRTACPQLPALRAGFAALATLSFFQAFRLLPFAEVFVFIGLMPLIAALMAGPVLGERVRPGAWLALAAAFAGVWIVHPGAVRHLDAGHSWALCAAVAGTASMTLARRIGRHEARALAQVFYPNLAIGVAMGLALPFAWQPMAADDVGWIGLYALLLFAARWLLVVALRWLAAHAVTPLMNLQFAWMAGLGYAAFGEVPTAAACAGAAVVAASGLYLVLDQMRPDGRLARAH